MKTNFPLFFQLSAFFPRVARHSSRGTTTFARILARWCRALAAGIVLATFFLSIYESIVVPVSCPDRAHNWKSVTSGCIVNSVIGPWRNDLDEKLSRNSLHSALGRYFLIPTVNFFATLASPMLYRFGNTTFDILFSICFSVRYNPLQHIKYAAIWK